MKMSRKSQYAIKALFELAWRNHWQTATTRDIAAAQQIPARFAEIILNELKHGGFVESRRGSDGGFMLVRDPAELMLLEIIEYIDGPIAIGDTTGHAGARGDEALAHVWQDVNNAVERVCRSTSIADLVEFERAKRSECALNYSI